MATKKDTVSKNKKKSIAVKKAATKTSESVKPVEKKIATKKVVKKISVKKVAKKVVVKKTTFNEINSGKHTAANPHRIPIKPAKIK